MIPNPVSRYLQDFRSRNALHLFIVFFAAGTVTILQQWASAITAPTCVLAYGVVLYVTQNKFQIELTNTVKDSPYFLGFSLTLIALWFVFDQAARAQTGELSLAGLSGSIGAALGTTIAGLLVRQTLQSRGVLEEERGAILRDLRNELRRHTEQFSESQSRLVNLIDEFVSSREDLFSREEEAARKYVNQIERSGHLLERVDSEFTSSLEEFSDRMNEQLDRLEQAAQDSNEELSTIRNALREAVATHQNQSERLLQDSVEQTERIHDELSQAIDAHQKTVQQSLSLHEQRIESLDGLSERYKQTEQDATASMRRLAEDLEAVRSEIDSLHQSLQQLPPVIKQLPRQVEQMREELGRDSQKVSRELTNNLETIAEDVEAIDQVIDDVVEVLQNKIRQVS